jgi:periplasmic protein TonB
LQGERDKLMLVLGGSIAVHVLLLVVIDAGGQYSRGLPRAPTPSVELVDIVTEPPPPPPKPPPPPPAMKSVEPEPEPPKAKIAEPRKADPPPDPVPPPVVPPGPPDPNSGGAPVVTMKDVAPSARGVAVRQGEPTTRRVGQGGTGTGTGAGSGAGSAAPPKPMSVATIKTRAMPKGDYSFDAAKDYPPQAKQQGIEGQIRVRLLVDASGKVAEKRLLNKLGYGLDELALARAAKFEFEPARDTDDRAVASVVVWTFTFTLPE